MNMSLTEDQYKYLETDFFSFKFRYYLKPSLWMNDGEFEALCDDVDYVNNSQHKLNYGIFCPENKFMYDNMLICVIYKENEPVGLFYNYIIENEKINKKLIHQGLVLINKNDGLNLMFESYAIANCLLYHMYGEYYVSNISNVPAVVGIFSESFDQVWPHPDADLKRPKIDYNVCVSLLHHDYIKKVFLDSDKLQIDYKRYILKSNSKELGFTGHHHDLPRDPKFIYNIFCFWWIKYDENEDMIQIGIGNIKKAKQWFFGLSEQSKNQLNKLTGIKYV